MPRVETPIVIPQIATPATPAAGSVALYAKSDGLPYYKNDQGTEGSLAVGVSSWAATLGNVSTVTETVVAQFSLAAGALTANMVLDLAYFGQVGSTATQTLRIRIGPLGTIVDPLAIAFPATAAGVANAHLHVRGVVSCLTTGTLGTATATGQVQLANGVVGPVTGAFAAATVNTSLAQKVSLTCQMSSQTGQNAVTSRGASLTRLTP